jgi:hypothetical protein
MHYCTLLEPPNIKRLKWAGAISKKVALNPFFYQFIISAAVWNTFDEIDSKVLSTGQQWQRGIPGQSSWYDQTNRVRIVGRADSRYYLDFKSWDD